MKEYTYQYDAEEVNTNENAPILKITKSSLIGTYKWCPKKYEFSYIQKLPQDQSEAMVAGSIMHNAYEDWYNEFDVKKAEAMSPMELQDYALSLFPIDDYTDFYHTMAAWESNRFLDSRSEGTLDSFLPVINEVTLDAEVLIRRDESHLPLRFDHRVHLQGIIDRMFEEEQGYVPVEFKTGAYGKHKATSMRKEMAFYKWLFDSTTREDKIAKGLNPDKEITHWAWYFPKNDAFVYEKVKSVSMTGMRKNVVELLKSYEEGTWEANYSERTCPVYCSYYSICDAADNAGWFDI